MRHGVSAEPAQTNPVVQMCKCSASASASACESQSQYHPSTIHAAAIAMTPTTRCKCIPHAVGTRKCTSIDLLVPFGGGTSMADRPLGGLIPADRLVTPPQTLTTNLACMRTDVLACSPRSQYRLTCSGTSYTCHGCGRVFNALTLTCAWHAARAVSLNTEHGTV
ncbi:hypothetical protein BCR44DRAFT_44523, partial [Catenaria anguillulae PL171]